MPATEPSSGPDVVDFLIDQHQQIKSLCSEVSSVTGAARQESFDRLRRLLAVHETAEELIVHPRARRVVQDVDHVVEDRLREEHDAKQVLAELEKLDIDSDDFSAKFDSFCQDVLAHAEAEEREEFSRLSEQLDSDELASLGRAAELAVKLAPTRPHPGVESGPANLLAGPFAAMLDRARDLITGHADQR
ncbi:MAG TPA: hemerythrin domain-containing protein [Jatrophihabitans sp.]|nr:hemerythrin domain-containing protein [Jatrophihabitans sp.]